MGTAKNDVELTGMMTTKPSPPFPIEEAWPGRPPSAIPVPYEASSMLYVDAWPEEEPDEPGAVKAVAVAMQPPM